MAKLFNLKTYKKISGDEPISRRLKEQHEETANVITEKQLDDRRVEEKNVIMEKLLDAKRIGSATVITERNLNESKGMFSPLRNDKTSAGNINKIEEQRLRGKISESEKYEASSEIPKQKRWWENLKEASSKATIKIAQGDPSITEEEEIMPRKPVRKIRDNDSYRFKGGLDKDLTQFKPEDAFGLATKMEEAEETGEIPSLDIPKDTVETDEEEENLNTEDDIWLDEGSGYKESRYPIATMTFKFRFNADKFNDLEDVRQAALDEVIKLKPNLEGKVSTMEFLDPIVKGDTGIIILPLIGDEYFEEIDETGDEAGEELSGIIDESKIYIGKKNIDGTPMVTGLVYLSPQGMELAKNEPELFEQSLSDAIMEARPELDKSIDTLVGSFNLAKASEGKISFMVSENLPEENEEDFPIIDEGNGEEGPENL